MTRIDPLQDPPKNVLLRRRQFIQATIIFLGLILGAVAIGVSSLYAAPHRVAGLENLAVTLFIIFGIGFVYSSEKLLGYRRLVPAQRQEIQTLAVEFDDIAVYCRQVAEQNRELVVLEYDALTAHAARLRDAASESPEYGPAPRPDDEE